MAPNLPQVEQIPTPADLKPVYFTALKQICFNTEWSSKVLKVLLFDCSITFDIFKTGSYGLEIGPK